MKSLDKWFITLSHVLIVVALAGSSTIAFSDATIAAKTTDLIIVVHADGTYTIYGGQTGKSIDTPCILCDLDYDVKSCRKLYEKKELCAGSVDTTLQWVRNFSVLFTRTTQSPDICYRQVCMGGSCKNYPYNC